MDTRLVVDGGKEEECKTLGDKGLETGILPRANLNIDEGQDSATRTKDLSEPMIVEVCCYLEVTLKTLRSMWKK